MILKIYTNDQETQYLECTRFSVIDKSKIGKDILDDALQIGVDDSKFKHDHSFIAIDDVLYELHYLACYVINDKGQTVDRI